MCITQPQWVKDPILQHQHNAALSHYNAVNFLQNTHDKQPILEGEIWGVLLI